MCYCSFGSTRRIAPPFLLVFSLFVALTLSCSDDDSTGTTNPPAADTTVGPAGGTVTGTAGASVVIPPGALAAETRITVTTIASEDDLAEDLGLIEFCGAVDFGPDGQQFALPVTITIPSPTPLTPGSQFPLMYYSDSIGCWVQSASLATVAPDGLTYSGQVSHFSAWSGGPIGPDGLFDSFESDLGDGSNAQGALDLYMIYFMQNIADIGDKGIKDGQCHEVVGLRFDLTYEIDGVAGSLYEAVGQTSGNIFMIDYKLDRVTISSSTWFDLFIVIYYKCSPDLNVSAAPSSINVDEQSTVTATLSCDGQPMGGSEIRFEAAGGMGTLDPTTATTNRSGQVRPTFTATDEGREAVFAYYTACQGRPSQSTEAASTYIEIGDSWSGTMNLTFHHSGEGVGWVFDDAVTINFDLEIDEGTITGTGTGSHVMMCTSTHQSCVINGHNAPAFNVGVSGAVAGDYLEFQVIPTDLYVYFNVYCPDPPMNMPVLAYSNIEASIMGQNIFIHALQENGATDSGSGSEGFGEDIPVDYTYTVTLQSGN